MYIREISFVCELQRRNYDCQDRRKDLENMALLIILTYCKSSLNFTFK